MSETRELVERLRGTLPVCPFDRRSPDYRKDSTGKPCPVCGGTEEGPDQCRGADTRCMNEAAATLEARDARIEALERQLADTEHWRQYWARHYEDVEERLDATEADRDRLAAKNAKLKGFAKAAMILSWEGYTIDGLTFQDLAEEHGVIRRVSYDPTEHGPSDIEPGEPWFVLSDALFEPQGDEHG